MHGKDDLPESNDPSEDTSLELRKRAEKFAADNAAVFTEDFESMWPAEIRVALHELRVHQIELEMQNEELRRTHAELDAKQAWYFDLYELAPAGFASLDEQGSIMETNLTFTSLLNTTRSALICRPFSRFIAGKDQDAFYLHQKQLFRTGQTGTCELRMVKSDNVEFWIQLTTSMGPLQANNRTTPSRPGSAKTLCHAMVIDIDGRKREENVLSENNAALAQQLAEQGKQLATDHGTLQMLVRTLSTELLAPLRRQENRIMNLAGKETCQTDKVVADLLEKTHLETGDMIRLINELAMRIDPQLCVPRRPAD